MRGDNSSGDTKNSRYAYIALACYIKGLEVTYLLINITAWRTPSMHLIIASDPVDGGLRVDGKVPERIHLGQLIGDDGRF
jgi:hypothetical protein